MRRHAAMIDRALTQHTGPAEHVVRDHDRRRRVRPGRQRRGLRVSLVGPKIATPWCRPRRPGASRRNRSTPPHALATSMPASVGRSLLPQKSISRLMRVPVFGKRRAMSSQADRSTVRADHHDAPAPLVDDQVRQLGEPLGQPLLGAAVGGARRKHHERLIEIEADVAQQLPGLARDRAASRANGGPCRNPERRRQRLVVGALMQLAARLRRSRASASPPRQSVA